VSGGRRLGDRGRPGLPASPRTYGAGRYTDGIRQATSEARSIQCLANGPYVVKGIDKLTDSRGQSTPTKPLMRLCRCGASSNKPFCDDTHTKISFSSEKLTDGSLDKREDYRSPEVIIHDNRGICSHAGFCTDCLPAVFRMNTESWINADGGTGEEIIETICRCPSGALSYSVDGVEHRDRDRGPEIVTSKDGPYWVRGWIELEDEPLGHGASKEHYTLCRCGGSKSKPRCDGSHWYLGFKDLEHRVS
jgi:CDGSH-type Zn-finger protein